MPETQTQIDSLREDIRAISDSVPLLFERVAVHDTQFDRIDARLDAHDTRFDRVDEQLAEILRRLPKAS